MSGIDMNWLNSAEGESLLSHFYNHSVKKRKIYGILERPLLPASIEEVTYKIFMIGRPTTPVVTRLSGHVGDNNISSEINGIRKTSVYWPVKVWDKVVLFKLNFWDTSESSIKKYNHILPVCKNKIDAACAVFSFEDTNSFSDIPHLFNSMNNLQEKPGNIVIGTNYKPWSTLPVTDNQIKDFENKYRIKVIKMDLNKNTARPEIFDCSFALNTICKVLWNRDQEFITKQIIHV